ncbi:hypothetical protein ACHAXS_011246 [Conticribra weissflogii]
MENGSGSDDDLRWLPKSSAAYLSSSSCADDMRMYDAENESFKKYILAGRHATSGLGWEVTPPPREFCQEDSGVCRANDNIMNAHDETSESNDGYYVRVFDLLNTAMQHDFLPMRIDISDVCHKGMEVEYQCLGGCQSEDEKISNMKHNDFANIPPKPNSFIPTKTWSSLWTTCHKKLSDERVSSSCIDIPGILVESSQKPLHFNNPCRLNYRMVDGSHRLCFRKYILSLLEGELIELKQQLIDFERNTASQKELLNDIQYKIMQKHQLLDQTTKGYFFVLNQTTFETLLTNRDPSVTWAKSRAILMRELTVDFKMKWERWMKKVMDHIRGLKATDANI